MNTWHERLKQEHTEGGSRLDKLDDFIANNGTFAELSQEQQSLLEMQSCAMETYVRIVEHRMCMGEDNE